MNVFKSINNKIYSLTASVVLLFLPASADAAGTALDAKGMSQQIAAQIPAIAGLLIGFFALAGLFFVGDGIMKLVAKGNPQGGGQQITASQIAIHIGAGTVLLTLAVIIAISRNSLFGAGGTGSQFDSASGAGIPTL